MQAKDYKKNFLLWKNFLKISTFLQGRLEFLFKESSVLGHRGFPNDDDSDNDGED